ncbi:MAG: xanthine dehydrogenase accessory protein XdhC [Oligoflexia bacterium]|nr:xanthine dehydrogenase accessory protein XdhC [Oligoflexia bacterium]
MNLTWNWILKAQELLTQNRKFAIVTVTNINGSAPREIGAKMIVLTEKEFFGTIGGGALEKEVIGKVIKMLEEESDETQGVQEIQGVQEVQGIHRLEFSLNNDLNMICGGSAEVLVEIINTNPDVYIFGSGHVCLALTSVLQETPFNLHVIDERVDWLEKLPPNVTRHKMHWKDFINSINWNKNKSYVVIMTPGHVLDRNILELVMNKSTKYIGMMGSKSKWLIVKDDLIQKGFSSEKIEQIHCPIGYSIGGKSPAEIAISISAELVSILYNVNK